MKRTIYIIARKAKWFFSLDLGNVVVFDDLHSAHSSSKLQLGASDEDTGDGEDIDNDIDNDYNVVKDKETKSFNLVPYSKAGFEDFW